MCRILALIGLIVFAAVASANERVMVMIDVSGSMRSNDPLDRRVDAAKLLIEMFPANTEASIAMFDGEATVLVPLTPVDNLWRRAAVSSLKKIHSKGQRTNFLQAVRQAADTLDKDGHLILLTDGALDVAQSTQANQQARQQLINTLLPDLKSRNIQLHSLGLGQNLDAQLLSKMGQITLGSYAQVKNASELSRLFGKTIDNIAPPMQLAIRGEQFTVDQYIDEFTALLFHDENKTVNLVDPLGNRSRGKANVRVFEGPDFTMFTVSKPAAGSWAIDAEGGIDGRVSILSDLRLEVDIDPFQQALPLQLSAKARLIMGQSIPQDAALKAMVQAKGELYGGEKQQQESQLLDARVVTQPEVDGSYHINFSPQSVVGDYQIEIVLDGRTFERLWRKEIQFNPLIQVSYEIKDTTASVTLALSQGSTQGARALAVLNNEVRLVLNQTESGWQGQVDAPYGDHQIAVEVSLASGERYTQTINFSIEPPPQPEADLSPPIEALAEVPIEQVDEVPDTKLSWLVWAIMAGGNIGLMLILVGLWRMVWAKSARVALAAVRQNLQSTPA